MSTLGNDMGDNMGGTGASFSSTFRGRSTAMSQDELRRARESRAAEALRMKDEQLKMLSEQVAALMETLNKLEEDTNTLNLEKLAIEQENRSLRDTNFELQSKARNADTIAKRKESEVVEKDQQIRIMTDQNSELVRLLECEEVSTSQLQSEVSELRAQLDEIRQKYGALMITAKTHEEVATKSAKEGQLRAEEIRLLRVETEQLKQQNTELKMKTQVEVEGLQEQLRVRKEKQYQLLEKLQAQEEAKRQAEDQVAGMEEQLRGLHARNVDLEEQIKVQNRSKSNIDEANKELQLENQGLFENNKALQVKIDKSERERNRMEVEARDSGDKLREMAEKVFQLLERLKLADLGKSKAMEALKKKELDMAALQKKNARLIKETADEANAKTAALMDVQSLQEQVRAVKLNNAAIAKKSKEEATLKVKAMEECEQLKEQKKSADARISFLLNKVQSDEEARAIQAEDRKKLEAQVMSYTEKCDDLQRKLTEMGESNRMITQGLRVKQEELNEISVKYEHMVKEVSLLRNQENDKSNNNNHDDSEETRAGAPDDIDNVRLNEGRGRFYVEAKTAGGGSVLTLKARKPSYKEWLERYKVNEFLKRSQTTTRFRDLVVEKFAAVYGLLMVEEEEKNGLVEQLTVYGQQMEVLQRKCAYIQDTLATEEDAKRRMLLRYIHAVKHSVTLNEGGGGGVLSLAESSISDEEVNALAAVLRNNTSIEELNLRNNKITDDGVKALQSVLAGKSGLRLVDLRGNKIGKGSIKGLAEALERSERVRHVYVHAGGKIEALGVSDDKWAAPRGGGGGGAAATATTQHADGVSTVCVVDIRDNTPETTTMPYELMHIDAPVPSMAMLNSGNNTNSNTLGSSLTINRNQLTNTPPRKGKSKKLAASTSAKRMSNDDSAAVIMSTAERMKAQIKAHSEKFNSLRESAWQGRAEGFDSNKTSEVDLNRESLRLRKKNKEQLPPLIDNGPAAVMQEHANFSLDPAVGSAPSANNNNNNANGGKAGGGGSSKKVKAPLSESQLRLQNSPFLQPVVPPNLQNL